MAEKAKFEVPMSEIKDAYAHKNDSAEAADSYRMLMYKVLERLVKSMALQWSYKSHGNQLATYEDLFNDAIVEMLTHLDSYDPNISMPSTYFKVPMEAALKKKTQEFSIKVTEYYLDIIAEADRILKENGMKGIDDPEVDIDMLVDIMGIPVKTAKTIIELTRRTYCSLEDPDYVGSINSMTPEESAFCSEDKKALVTACESLTPLEKYVVSEVILDKTSHRALVTKLKSSETLCKKFSLDKAQITGTFLKQIESRAIRTLSKKAGKVVLEQFKDDDLYIQATPEDIFTANTVDTIEL